MVFQKNWFEYVSENSLYYFGNTRSLQVNVLSSRPKISDLIKNNFF